MPRARRLLRLSADPSDLNEVAIWLLSGGAKFMPATLLDGKTGYVLDMPPNSTATSPNFCLDRDYPKSRAMIADVYGPPNLSFYVT